MRENWPPKGYSDPVEYTRNTTQIYILAVTIAVVFGIFVLPDLYGGITKYQESWSAFTEATILANHPLVSKSIAGILGIGVLLLITRYLMTPIHEGLHYVVGLALDLNPDYGYQDGLLSKNPRVVALSTNIHVWQNMLMIIAPFVGIGVLSWAIMTTTDGILGGLAAVVLLTNSAASCQDIYHYLRLSRMDSESVFANFEIDDEIRTEYAVPEE